MLDHFGRTITYLRLSVTELCNLRCRYCMPAEGVCKKSHNDMLTEEEMIRAVMASEELGIRKVRITGGEPLVKPNIISILEKTALVPGIEELCITTNGTLLPEMAGDIKKAGVKNINISLDTLDPEKYNYITRIGTLDRALEGIRAAIRQNFEKVKINAVLIGGFNDDEIPALCDLTRKYPIDVQIGRASCRESDPCSEALKYDDGVASMYKFPGAPGNVGLINPLSAHFCASCSRIRITADGWVKPCLHKEAEYRIKGMDQEQMKQQIIKAIEQKPEWHGALSSENRSMAGRNMNQIGG